MGDLPVIDYTLSFPYTRTTGPVMGPFLTALRDGQILGGRCGDRVLCPPLEYDPDTGAEVAPDLVPVGPGGTVTGSTWVSTPTEKHPFAEPFAFATIALDGADTPLIHAVKAPGPVEAGTRVMAQFRDERVGAITDVYFVPEADAVEQTIAPGDEPVEITEHLIGVRIQEDLYPFRKRYAQALLDGKILGQRSPKSGKVYVPSRGYDNMERVPMTEADDVFLPDIGTVVSFTEITPIQYHGQTETDPYIRCAILLDGADQPVTGIDIRDLRPPEFKVGLRLRCVWRPPAERDVSELDNRMGAIPEGVYERWEPTGEPDVNPDELRGQAW
ncbi:MAG: hypothetical protein HKN26_13815 [Acidimicrobiales bacterium]|nr:hypothetical protein [Acidimicrobiales bacterium]